MRHLPLLLLCCLLLTGCAHPPAEAGETTIPTTEPAALYDAGSPMEQQYPGAVRTYPLPMEDAYGLRALGNDLLVFSGTDSTTLTLLTGAELYPMASIQLTFHLDTEDPSLYLDDRQFSFYDPERRETLVLDRQLRKIRSIAAPQDMVGSPILSQDGKILYYCTPNAIRAWDLESGLRRLMRAVSGASLTGLHLNDTAVQYTAGNSSLVISVEDGRLLWEGDKALELTTHAGRYYARLPAGMSTLLLFGQEDPWALTSADFNKGVCQFLKNRNGAVTAVTGPETELSYYDLSTGLRTSILPLKTRTDVQVECTRDGWVYILAHDEHYDQEVLYRWDVDALPSNDPALYTFPHFTEKAPDREGLARCQAYADDIGSRYGLKVLVGQAAADAHPWDYDFEPEYVVPFIQKELELLDQSLSHFPQVVLDETMSHFSSLTICLVRSITGTAESGSVEEANGLHFLDGTDVKLALAVGPDSDHPLYHELFHVMETHLLGGSTAFDQWDNINPPDFAYRYRYEDDPELDQYLQGEERSFIDRYSMSFPKEDRARIMEYAMTPGNEELFRHKILQAKLDTLCKAIRQAYGLKKSPDVYLWEQYLNTPMAYTK